MPIFQIFVHSSTSLLYFIIIEYLFKYNSHKLHNVIKLIKVKRSTQKSPPFYHSILYQVCHGVGCKKDKTKFFLRQL